MDFKIGEFISGTLQGRACQAVILDKDEDDQGFLILSLLDHQCAEVPKAELIGWSRAAIPDARWVEVFRPEESKPFFAGYLPSFQAALAVHQAFHKRDGDYHVVIFTASEYEERLLEETIDPASARGYW